MQNQEAFTYCWIDHKTNMLYIGYHKGQQDDGYVCSSKWMLEEYNKRPEDFTRMILAEGTQDDCLMLETSILRSVDAKHNPEYYNQRNDDEKFVLKHQTESSKKLLSRINMGHPVSKKTRKAVSVTHKGKDAWNKGKGGYLTAESIDKMKMAHLGKKHTAKTRVKMSRTHKSDHSLWVNLKPGHNKSKKMSEEQLKKLRGRKRSKEFSEDCKERQKNKWQDPEYRKMMRNARWGKQ